LRLFISLANTLKNLMACYFPETEKLDAYTQLNFAKF